MERPFLSQVWSLVLSSKLDISLVNQTSLRRRSKTEMEDNVAISVICDFLVNCDEEIETFLRDENNFDFVAIAGVSCCFELF